MKPTTVLMTLLCVSLAGGCSRGAAVDDVPVGSDVQLTRKDGALVEGRLTARDPAAVKVAVGTATKSVPREEIADFRVKAADKPAEIPKAAKFREVSVPSDARITARLDTAINTATTAVEAPLRAELTEPIVIDGVTAVPVASEIRGNVRAVQSSGKVKGRASVELFFDTLIIGGKSQPIAARFARSAEATTMDDAKKIGIPAAGGAIIGAIVGGKKGAAIGAAAGGGAGAAVVLTTPGREIEIESGTVIALETGREIVVEVPLK